MKASIHLKFDGRCEEALRFYADVLGGEVRFLLRYADSPAGADVPEEWRSKVLHSSLGLGDLVIAMSDQLPGEYRVLRGFHMLVSPPDAAAARRVFDALAAQGSTQMELQKTFWTEAFGVVTDRFGVPWEINCEALPASAPQ